jgi:peptide deformylase
MIRDIVPATDPKLRQKSKPIIKIDKKTLSLIKDMKDTLIAQRDPEGIGLAAPQIGKNVRIFIMMPDKDITVVINPNILEITLTEKKKRRSRLMEGCLSLPHYYGPLRRAEKVKLEYLNENGAIIKNEFTGLEAQIVLHEVDHLNGVLFVDRLLEQKKPLYEYKNGEWEEVQL